MNSDTKRRKSDVAAADAFGEKLYLTYVKSALDALDIVCIIRAASLTEAHHGAQGPVLHSTCIACTNKPQNDTLQIDTLASKIRLPPADRDAISLANLTTTLRLLIANVARLDNKACLGLVSAVLDYRWLQLDAGDAPHDAFCSLYAQFLSVLVLSLPKYLQEVTLKLVREFESAPAHALHHAVLAKIIKYIPTLVNSLPRTLQKQFPHHLLLSTQALSNYVANLLKVLTYCPELQYDVWQMIIECCIKLDVELQNELDDLDDDEIEEIINGDQEEFVIEGDEDGDDEEEKETNADSDSDSESLVGQTEYLVESTRSTATIQRISQKLDAIMHLLLTTTATSFTAEELTHGNGVFLFNTLTSLFKTHILPTHFTKLIQFTLFHISQYQPELADLFLVLLIDVAFSTSEILERRLKAMQYLLSYIARARNLLRHQIVFVVSYLIGWLNKYVIERECEVFGCDNDNTGRTKGGAAAGGMERFKLFYAAFQLLLYIFCFRYNVLQTGSDSWECDLDNFFQRAMISKFNPLKFCDETVVYIFAKIATKLNVCYCYSIIEHNKRERMIQTNGGSSSLPLAVSKFKAKQEFLDLEAYFPFDPLVLPQSKKLISTNYVEWLDVNPSNEDEDDDLDSGSHLDTNSDDEEPSESEDDEE